jgi:hypothetical protein
MIRVLAITRNLKIHFSASVILLPALQDINSNDYIMWKILQVLLVVW